MSAAVVRRRPDEARRPRDDRPDEARDPEIERIERLPLEDRLRELHELADAMELGL